MMFYYPIQNVILMIFFVCSDAWTIFLNVYLENLFHNWP